MSRNLNQFITPKLQVMEHSFLTPGGHEQYIKQSKLILIEVALFCAFRFYSLKTSRGWRALSSKALVWHSWDLHQSKDECREKCYHSMMQVHSFNGKACLQSLFFFPLARMRNWNACVLVVELHGTLWLNYMIQWYNGKLWLNYMVPGIWSYLLKTAALWRDHLPHIITPNSTRDKLYIWLSHLKILRISFTPSPKQNRQLAGPILITYQVGGPDPYPPYSPCAKFDIRWHSTLTISWLSWLAKHSFPCKDTVHFGAPLICWYVVLQKPL